MLMREAFHALPKFDACYEESRLRRIAIQHGGLRCAWETFELDVFRKFDNTCRDVLSEGRAR